MPASSIAQILLRVFAIQFVLYGLIQSASVIALFVQLGDFQSYSLVTPVGYFLLGTLIWVFAPVISRLAAGSNDGEFKLEGITETLLYSTTILALGLYFTLNSFAGVFNWIHFFTVYRSPEYGFHQEQQPSYYDLTEAALTLIAGVLLVFTSKRWATKLARARTVLDSPEAEDGTE